MPIQRMLLISYIMFSIISMLLVVGFAFTRSRTVLQSEIRTNLEAQAITIMQQIDALMFERAENIYGWSRLDLMQDIKVGDVDKRLTRFLANLKVSYAGLYNQLFAAYRGKIVASSEAGMIGDSWKKTGSWQSMPIQGTHVDIGRPGNQDGKDSLLLSIPLHDAFTDAALGTLYASYDWSDISHLLDKAVGNTNSRAVLIDGEGVILSASGNAAQGDRLHLTGNDYQILGKAPHGTFSRQDETGSHEMTLVGYDTSRGIRGLPGLGWHVLVSTPSAIAFAPITQLLWSIILLLVIITPVAILLARQIAKRIASPIQELTRVTRQLPEQLDNTVIDIQGQGEVNVLAAAFKKMLEELKASRERLIRLSKLAAVGEMSAMLAHEVRNPLGILRSSAQLLERQPGLDDRGRSITSYMVTECDRIDHLVSSLLESARPRQPVFSVNDINLIINKVIELTRVKADKKGIRISYAPGAEAMMLECDHDQVTQVILNLVLNAVQILPEEKGLIHIDTETFDDQMIIRISDNGPGIPEPDREQVFEPFVSSRPGGLGLGLAVVREIIQMHHGSIIVEDSPSGGAQFRISIPLHRNPKPST